MGAERRTKDGRVVTIGGPSMFTSHLFGNFVPDFDHSKVGVNGGASVDVVDPVFLYCPRASIDEPIVVRCCLV